MSDVSEFELCDDIFPCPLCDNDEAERDREEGLTPRRLWRHIPLGPPEKPVGQCRLDHAHGYMCEQPERSRKEAG